MAKPIRATPTLSGDDAINFVLRMIREEKKPSKNRINAINEARKHFVHYARAISAV